MPLGKLLGRRPAAVFCPPSRKAPSNPTRERKIAFMAPPQLRKSACRDTASNNPFLNPIAKGSAASTNNSLNGNERTSDRTIAARSIIHLRLRGGEGLTVDFGLHPQDARAMKSVSSTKSAFSTVCCPPAVDDIASDCKKLVTSSFGLFSPSIDRESVEKDCWMTLF